MLDMWWLLVLLIYLFIGGRVQQRKIEKSAVYVRQLKLVLALKEQNLMSYEERRKKILPVRFKMILFCIITILFVLFVFVVIKLNLFEIDLPIIKILFLAGVMGLGGYIGTRYVHIRNEYVYQHETGIYKEIAKNTVETVDELKNYRILSCIMSGILFGLALV